jgi:hypothetical protein
VRIALRADGTGTKTVTIPAGTTETIVTGLLSEPTPAGRTFKFTELHREAEAIGSYRLFVTFPDGMRALAIREALPKLRKAEIVPRAALDQVDGRLGARLRVDNVQQGDSVSLQIDLARAAPPWEWLAAGLALAVLYLFSFRDLVRRAS